MLSKVWLVWFFLLTSVLNLFPTKDPLAQNKLDVPPFCYFEKIPGKDKVGLMVLRLENFIISIRDCLCLLKLHFYQASSILLSRASTTPLTFLMLLKGCFFWKCVPLSLLVKSATKSGENKCKIHYHYDLRSELEF